MSAYIYRRGSIFWALTLIALGALFLYHNFNPTLHPWEIIGRYWPVLIIFWGLSKLIDYVQSEAHPESIPPPRFTASEVILLVLILLLGTMVSKIALRPWPEWPRNLGFDLGDLLLEPFTYTQTLSTAAKPKLQLLIINRRGDIEIRPADQPTLVAEVRKTIRAENEDAARRISNDLKTEFVEQGGRTAFQTNLDSIPDAGRRVRLDLSLHVPQATTAEVSTDRGDVILDGLTGEQDITARHGDVHVSGVKGLVRVHKSGGGLTALREVKGNVELDGRGRDIEIADVTGAATVNGEFSGTIRFSNLAGTVRYNSSRTDLTLQKLTGRLNMELGSLEASGLDGPLELTTRQKDITLEEFKQSVKINNTNGLVRLRVSQAPKFPIEVNLDKGDIELELPGSSSFEIRAASRHGEVQCDFSGLKVTREDQTPSIEGAYGKGGPTIHLTTAYGTIHLARVEKTEPGRPLPRGKSSHARNRRFFNRRPPRVAGRIIPAV